MNNRKRMLLTFKEYNHKFSYCKHCCRPIVICGNCGFNTCGGGGEENCKDNCKSANVLDDLALKYKLFPLHLRIRGKIDRFLFKIYFHYNNIKYIILTKLRRKK